MFPNYFKISTIVRYYDNNEDTLKPCRDPDNCTYEICWFNHDSRNETTESSENEQDFSKVPVNPKPPSNL